MALEDRRKWGHLTNREDQKEFKSRDLTSSLPLNHPGSQDLDPECLRFSGNRAALGRRDGRRGRGLDRISVGSRGRSLTRGYTRH